MLFSNFLSLVKKSLLENKFHNCLIFQIFLLNPSLLKYLHHRTLKIAAIKFSSLRIKSNRCFFLNLDNNRLMFLFVLINYGPNFLFKSAKKGRLLLIIFLLLNFLLHQTLIISQFGGGRLDFNFHNLCFLLGPELEANDPIGEVIENIESTFFILPIIVSKTIEKLSLHQQLQCV